MKCRRCPQVVHGGGRGQRDWSSRERDAREGQRSRESLHHYLPPGGASKRGLKRMETESPVGKVVQRALFSVEVTPQKP